MKRAIGLTIMLLSLLFCCSCVAQNVGGKKVEPVRTETKEFDLKTAMELIAQKDKVFADITKKETATRQEFEQFLTDIENAYPDCEHGTFQYMFFNNGEFENKDTERLHLNKEMFYPTIYHQGIEVVAATVTDSFYDEEYSFLNDSILTIREAYVGDNEKLAGWYREYNLKKYDDGTWVVRDFSGSQMNFLEEGMDYHFLPFK